MTDSKYKNRSVTKNTRLWALYEAHALAMTREKLRGKAAIAAELAWRDLQIEELQAEVRRVESIKKYSDEDIRHHLARGGTEKFLPVFEEFGFLPGRHWGALRRLEFYEDTTTLLLAKRREQLIKLMERDGLL